MSWFDGCVGDGRKTTATQQHVSHQLGHRLNQTASWRSELQAQQSQRKRGSESDPEKNWIHPSKKSSVSGFDILKFSFTFFSVITL